MNCCQIKFNAVEHIFNELHRHEVFFLCLCETLLDISTVIDQNEVIKLNSHRLT